MYVMNNFDVCFDYIKDIYEQIEQKIDYIAALCVYNILHHRDISVFDSVFVVPDSLPDRFLEFLPLKPVYKSCGLVYFDIDDEEINRIKAC